MKKDKILILLSFLLIVLLSATYSYSKYKTEVSLAATSNVAKWNISVNGCTVTVEGQDEVDCDQVDVSDGTITYFVKKEDLTYQLPTGNETNIRPNVFAPGGKGRFDLNINPNDTEVAFRYTISLDSAPDTRADIQVYTMDGAGNKTYLYKENILHDALGNRVLDASGNPSFTFDMDDVVDTVSYGSLGSVITIPIYVDWIEHDGDADRIEFNAYDVELGSREGSSLLLPITMTFEQVVS